MHSFTRAAIGALCLGLAAFGVVAPATAASVASCRKETILGPNGIYIDRITVFANTILMQLRQRGYNVQQVEPWGGCVKATISDGTGRLHMEFFDPDTLEPLSTR